MYAKYRKFDFISSKRITDLEQIEMDNVRLISGNSHPQLAKKISSILNVPLVDTDVQYFSNTEIRPVIKESIRGRDIYIIQTGTFTNIKSHRSVNDHIMETLLLVKTCKRSDVKSITLVMPCYPYARQDKKDNPRGAISGKDVADFFEMAGVNRIICVDLHCSQIQGFFNIPCDNLYCAGLIHSKLKELYFDSDRDFQNNYVVIAPDEGALKRAKNYANLFRLPFMVLSKERDYSKKNVVDKSILIGDRKYLQDKTAIIVDDMCDTFGTILSVTNVLMEKGAKNVIVAVSHGIFSGKAIERMNSNDDIISVITSDSIPQIENAILSSKIEVYSIGSLLASVVERLVVGKSISDLFNFD
jgi:ribose-phosphate pyrophosphokinase